MKGYAHLIHAGRGIGTVSFVFQTHYQGDDPSVLIDNMGLFKQLVQGSGSSGMLLFRQIAAG